MCLLPTIKENLKKNNMEEDYFITEWDLSKLPANRTSIQFYYEATGPVNYTWSAGNGATGSGTLVANQTTANITGLPANTKITLSIEPTNFKRFYMTNGQIIPSAPALIAVQQWGSVKWSSMAYAFTRASNLARIGNDVPDLRLVTDMSYMFYIASSFNQNLNDWNIHKVRAKTYIIDKNSKHIVSVKNCGETSRTIYIYKGLSDLIFIGCQVFTKEEAINAVSTKYHESSAKEYIQKIEECFNKLQNS